MSHYQETFRKVSFGSTYHLFDFVCVDDQFCRFVCLFVGFVGVLRVFSLEPVREGAFWWVVLNSSLPLHPSGSHFECLAHCDVAHHAHCFNSIHWGRIKIKKNHDEDKTKSFVG